MSHDPLPPGLDRPAVLAALRSRVARLERRMEPAQRPPPVGLTPELDAGLPDGGLSRGALHEVLATDLGAATAFCAVAMGRSAGEVVWIGARDDLYAPGLAELGLATERLIFVQASGKDVLWAAEQGLRCKAVAGVVLTVKALDLTTSRRLQLAAEEGGGLGIALCADTPRPPTTSSLTRWRVAAAPSDEDERPRWRLDLLRARNGRTGEWWMTLNHDRSLTIGPVQEIADTPADDEAERWLASKAASA
jgi:protein ImuA